MTKKTLAEVRTLVAQDSASGREALADMFWDWWGSKSSLPRKAQTFCARMLRFADALGLPDDTLVDLKENCPMDGKLYVSCQFHSAQTGLMLGWFTPACGHAVSARDGTKAQWTAFAAYTGSETKEVTAPNLRELLKLVKPA